MWDFWMEKDELKDVILAVTLFPLCGQLGCGEPGWGQGGASAGAALASDVSLGISSILSARCPPLPITSHLFACLHFSILFLLIFLCFVTC